MLKFLVVDGFHTDKKLPIRLRLKLSRAVMTLLSFFFDAALIFSEYTLATMLELSYSTEQPIVMTEALSDADRRSDIRTRGNRFY